jgi:MFS family permease
MPYRVGVDETGSPAAATGNRAEAPDIRRKLYALAFVDEFAPLYALFTLWFNDNDVSTSQISIVFIIWAALAVLLEVPSGALADRFDRRKLIASAFVLRAIGISVWLIWPSVTGLVIGAVLWAIHDAAASGAWEAMIHDQLDAVGRASTYGVVMARVSQFSNIGLAAGTIAASGLIQLGTSIDAIGWINVAMHGGSIALILALPDAGWVARLDDTTQRQSTVVGAGLAGTDEPTSYAAWWRTLRSGLSATRRQPELRRLAGIGALIAGLFIVDEYIPLLARERGASDTVVPLIVLAVWLGLIIGGEVAARRPDIHSSTLATALVGGAAVAAVAIALESPWALLGIAVTYGITQATWVVSDARFQAAAPRATRATVTSVRGLGEGLVAGFAFLLIAVLSDGDDPSPGLHWIVGLLALVSLLVWRWIPNRRTKQDDLVPGTKSS